MRILYVLTSLGMGGAEKLALALCEQMTQRGHEVSLLVLMPRLNEEWPAPFPRLHLDIRRSPVSLARGIARARRFAAEFEPDLIHSHSFHSNFLARLLKLRTPRPAVISTIHNVYEGGSPRMLAYRLTDRLSRRTVAVSKAAAERFMRLKAVPAKKCSVIVNGIDVSQFVPNGGSAREHARTDGNRRRARRQASSGLRRDALLRAKDYPNLLRAFCMVRAGA